MNNGKWRRQYWGGIWPEPIWFLYTDAGSNAFNAFDHIIRKWVVCDEDRIYLGGLGNYTLYTGASTGGGFLTCIDMSGGLVWEKYLKSDDGGSRIGAELEKWFDINPQTSGELVWSLVYDNTGYEYRAGTIDSSGDVGLCVDADLTGTTVGTRPFNGFHVCSNGDAWTYSTIAATGGRIQLLDYSSNYAAIVTQTIVDIFGTGTASSIDENHSGILQDDSLIIGNRTEDTPTRAAVMKITTGGTCTGIDFYTLSDSGDNAIVRMLCTDRSSNIYVLWNQTDSSEATSVDYITKLNSSLAEQWTVSVSGFADVILSTKACICASYDSAYLYLAVNAYGGGGVLTEGSRIVKIDASDGSNEGEWTVSTAAPVTNEDITGVVSLAVNSKSIILGMNWEDTSGYVAGYGLLKVPNGFFDKNSTYISKFIKSTDPTPNITLSSASPTFAAKTVNKSTLSTSPADATGDVDTAAFITPLVHDLTVQPIHRTFSPD